MTREELLKIAQPYVGKSIQTTYGTYGNVIRIETDDTVSVEDSGCIVGYSLKYFVETFCVRN